MPVSLAAIRKNHYGRLDESGHTYLDYAGAALYPSSLIDYHHQQLKKSILGSPKSSNPSSQLSNDRIELTRHRILNFFNADPLKYEVIFTANATAAHKLVGESFPFTKSSTLLLLADNHTSVIGMREFALERGANVRYVPLTYDMRAEDATKYFQQHSAKQRSQTRHLFAFPAQSNFSGVRHPLRWIQDASSAGWFVLVDAAAYAANTNIDLSQIDPDFLSVSFYKMFGFPSGIGALIAKKKSLKVLQRPWICGSDSNHTFTSVLTPTVLSNSFDASVFEDGTVDFVNIPAVLFGLDFLAKISMTVVRAHVTNLTRKLLASLVSLKWSDGERAVRVYGPEHIGMRGGTIAFDITYYGRRVDARRIRDAAYDEQISLRVGNFCNPGALEHALGIDAKSLNASLSRLSHTQRRFSTQNLSKQIGRGFFGCVRVSVGVANNDSDVRKFVVFLGRFCKRLEGQWRNRSGFSLDSEGAMGSQNGSAITRGGQTAEEKSWRDMWGSGRLKLDRFKWISGRHKSLDKASFDNNVYA